MSKRLQIATLILIVALGFILRVRGLDRVSFNEDEVHKVEAARAYLHDNFSLNLEHPMLMKSLIASRPPTPGTAGPEGPMRCRKRLQFACLTPSSVL